MHDAAIAQAFMHALVLICDDQKRLVDNQPRSHLE